MFKIIKNILQIPKNTEKSRGGVCKIKVRIGVENEKEITKKINNIINY